MNITGKRFTYFKGKNFRKEDIYLEFFQNSLNLLKKISFRDENTFAFEKILIFAWKNFRVFLFWNLPRHKLSPIRVKNAKNANISALKVLSHYSNSFDLMCHSYNCSYKMHFLYRINYACSDKERQKKKVIPRRIACE